MINRVINLFPLWAIMLSGIAYFNADNFVSLKSIIVPLLATVMFSMGMTLTWGDFKEVIKRPLIIAIAVGV